VEANVGHHPCRTSSTDFLLKVEVLDEALVGYLHLLDDPVLS